MTEGSSRTREILLGDDFADDCGDVGHDDVSKLGGPGTGSFSLSNTLRQAHPLLACCFRMTYGTYEN